MKSNRKRVVIDSAVQWSIGRRIISHWIAFFGLLVGVNLIIRAILAAPEGTFLQSAQTAVVAQIPQICIMLLILPIFLRDTLKLSNRFAGPIYRLRKSLETLADGTPMNPIRFRTGDFWMEMADKFNAVLTRVNALEAKNHQLETECRRLKNALRPTSTLAESNDENSTQAV